MRYTITKNNLHLVDSYLIKKEKYESELKQIKAIHKDSEVWERSMDSLCREWGVHNWCYKVGIERERTKDCDLNYPQPWYVRALYSVVGKLVWRWVK